MKTGSFSPRWLVVLAWSTGLAGLYVLVGLMHAVLVLPELSVEIAFGRTLAFWVGTAYLALLGWGFVPARPHTWFARRSYVLMALAVGAAGVAAASVSAVLWLRMHWAPAVGIPVTASLAVLLVGAVLVLWLAARDERRARAGSPDR